MLPIKDSFWARSYKGGTIHGCQNRTTGQSEYRVVYPNGNTRDVKSVRSAELLLNAASK